VIQVGYPIGNTTLLIMGCILKLVGSYEAENKVHDITRVPIRATCHAHPYLLDLITVIWVTAKANNASFLQQNMVSKNCPIIGIYIHDISCSVLFMCDDGIIVSGGGRPCWSKQNE